MINPEKLYTISEIVERGILPLTPMVIKKLIIGGDLIAVNMATGKVHHKWRIEGKEIIKFIKSRRTDKTKII